MTTLNISLPDQMKEFVEQQVGEGGYDSPSEYFRELLKEQQKRRAEDKLEELLREGLSRPASELTENDWEYVRNERSRVSEPGVHRRSNVACERISTVPDFLSSDSRRHRNRSRDTQLQRYCRSVWRR